MANEVRIKITADEKEATAAIAKVGHHVHGLKQKSNEIGDVFARNQQKIGLALTGMGAAILGFTGLAAKSAFEEQQGINRLSQALKNINVDYRANKAEIESVIAVQQKKTNFGDQPQRKALESLIRLTADYGTSLAALPSVLDMATSLNMDLNTAALLVGKALAGDTTLMSRYGIQLKENATKTEILAALTTQFGGAAESAATPMSQLKNTLSDLMDAIGDQLIPIITKGAAAIKEITERIMGWMTEHPKLTKAITISVAAFGALTLAIGPILLALPALIAGITALKGIMAAVPGPIGLMTAGLAVAAGAAAGFAMTKVIRELSQTRDIANETDSALSRVNDRLQGISSSQREFVASLEGKMPSGEIKALADELGRVQSRLREIASERTLAEGFARANTETGQYTKQLQVLAVEERELVARQKALIAEIESVRSGVKETSFAWQELIDVMGAVSDTTKATGRDFDALVQQLEAIPGAFAMIQVRAAELQSQGIGPVQAFKTAVLEQLSAVEAEINRLAQTLEGGAETVAAMREAGVPLVTILGLMRHAAAQVRQEIDPLTDSVNGLTAASQDATDATAGLRAEQEEAVTEAQRLLDSWHSIRIALNPVVQQFRASGLTVAQVIRGWADVTGRTVEDIISDLAAMGISIDGLEQVWRALGIPLDEIIARFADVEVQSDQTTDSIDRQRAALLNLQNVATSAAGRGRVVTPASAEAIEAAFENLRQEFRLKNPQPTARFPVSLEQFIEMLKFFGGDVQALGPTLAQFANALNLDAFQQFQHGGSFTVPGAGGPDSKLVAFRATPGERVAVAPQGRALAGVSEGITVVIQGPIYGFDDFERRVGQAVRNIKLRGGGV